MKIWMLCEGLRWSDGITVAAFAAACVVMKFTITHIFMAVQFKLIFACTPLQITDCYIYQRSDKEMPHSLTASDIYIYTILPISGSALKKRRPTQPRRHATRRNHIHGIY